MATENYNIHQILFSLERFENDEEKLGYLYKMKKELQRVIRCFDSSKTLPLKMYAVDNIQIEGNCEELKTFIRKQFASEKNNPWEKHHPNEGKLNALLMKEVVEYKKTSTVACYHQTNNNSSLGSAHCASEGCTGKNTYIELYKYKMRVGSDDPTNPTEWGYDNVDSTTFGSLCHATFMGFRINTMEFEENNVGDGYHFELSLQTNNINNPTQCSIQSITFVDSLDNSVKLFSKALTILLSPLSNAAAGENSLSFLKFVNPHNLANLRLSLDSSFK